MIFSRCGSTGVVSPCCRRKGPVVRLCPRGLPGVGLVLPRSRRVPPLLVESLSSVGTQVGAGKSTVSGKGLLWPQYDRFESCLWVGCGVLARLSIPVAAVDACRVPVSPCFRTDSQWVSVRARDQATCSSRLPGRSACGPLGDVTEVRYEPVVTNLACFGKALSLRERW